MKGSSDGDNPFRRALAATSSSAPRRTLADLVAPPLRTATMGSVLGIPQSKKRRVFFSFHYADIMRVNNVRLSGEFAKSPSDSGRDVEGFYDNSLWESRKRSGEEAIRNLIREGVKNSSAVCVLTGSETWSRAWVRYEIARGIIDGRGILVVHVNGLKHHRSGVTHSAGPNPLDYIGIYKEPPAGALSTPRYLLYELRQVWKGYGYAYEWHPYAKHTQQVDRPSWLIDPSPGYIMPLSASAAAYDYVGGQGHKNIGTWIDNAAVAAGR